jgi:hypothetical protein
VFIYALICGVLMAMRGLQHGCHESCGIVVIYTFGLWCVVSCEWLQHGCRESCGIVVTYVYPFYMRCFMWCVDSCERLLHGCHESAGPCSFTHVGCGVWLAVSGYHTGVAMSAESCSLTHTRVLMFSFTRSL